MFLDEKDCDSILHWMLRKWVPPDPSHCHDLKEYSSCDSEGQTVKYMHYCRKCGMRINSVVIRFPYEKR
jgi:hypothetical protein